MGSVKFHAAPNPGSGSGVLRLPGHPRPALAGTSLLQMDGEERLGGLRELYLCTLRRLTAVSGQPFVASEMAYGPRSFLPVAVTGRLV